MKISFDSALLWVIPYLYIVSIAYYWGFWGTLNIDVFNYYEVSDLVKGVTAPISSALYFSLVIVAILIISRTATYIFRKLPFWLHTALTLLMIIGCLYMAYKTYNQLSYTGNPQPAALAARKSTMILNTICHIAIFFIAIKISPKHENDEILTKNTVHFFGILTLLSLPVQSYAGGKYKAFGIQQNTEFDYITTDAVAGTKTLYKYLGKAGDFYILLTDDNLKRVIIPTEKLSPLIIEEYLDYDSLSISRFRVQKVALLRLAKPDSLKPASSR